jgi:hypothetical protein
VAYQLSFGVVEIVLLNQLILLEAFLVEIKNEVKESFIKKCHRQPINSLNFYWQQFIILLVIREVIL